MHLTKTVPDTIKEIVWDEKSVVRRVGGYDIDKTSLSDEFAKWLPKGALMAFDATTGKVQLVKTAKVAANAAKDATSFTIAKGSGVKVGDTLGVISVTAIDKDTSDEYDTITCAALANALTKDTILATANSANVIGFNYATVKIDAFPTCTITLQAYEIEEETAPQLLNDDIKMALTSRHAFVVR